MRTTIYLATACGLAVIRGCDESWVGEVCLNDKQIQCVAADRTRKGIVFCGTFGNGMFRTGDWGATWNALRSFTEPNVTALASSQTGAFYAGTELSAMYRSEDGGESWCELETLMTLSSAKSWSFPPRPETHHVQSILPDLAHPARLHVAIEAGALVHSDDSGRTWCDRVSSAPRDTHCLAVHPLDPARLHSAAGDGYFESLETGTKGPPQSARLANSRSGCEFVRARSFLLFNRGNGLPIRGRWLAMAEARYSMEQQSYG